LDDFEAHNLRIEVDDLKKKLKLDKRKKIEAMGIADMMVRKLKSMQDTLEFYSNDFRGKHEKT